MTFVRQCKNMTLLNMDTPQKTYEKQTTDTDKSWNAFCIYRDLGAGRSLEKVAEKQYPNTSKTGLKNLKVWSSKHKWVSRCRAFDADELQQQSIALQKIRLKRRLEIEREAWEKSKKYEAKAAKILAIPIVTPIKSEDGQTVFMPTDKWNLRDAIALDRYAHELAIFATGGETPNISELDAIKVLIQSGFLPVEVLETAERGLDDLRSRILQVFKNLNQLPHF